MKTTAGDRDLSQDLKERGDRDDLSRERSSPWGGVQLGQRLQGWIQQGFS